MMGHLKISITFTLRTAFHTTGNRWRWGADKALSITPDGRYVIPATTIKGFLRSQAEYLLNTWGHPICIGPEPGKCMDQTDRSPCLICQVFGNPRSPSSLRFYDAVLPDNAAASIRSGVAISRHRRAAYPQRLFFTETVEASSAQWEATCEGHFQEEAQRAAALVALAVAWGATIGGGRTRGLGWLAQGKVSATYDGQPIPEEVIKRFWRTWEEGEGYVAEN